MSPENDPASSAKPSQVPSWVMVGFALGILTMWAFDSGDDAPAPPPAATTPSPTKTSEELAPRDNPLSRGGKPSLEVVQDLFAGLRDWAFWTDNRTEIAVWNRDRKSVV